MQISPAGIALIEQFEGFVNHVYNDVAGYPTIGYGHKLKSGETFPNGITEPEASNLLLSDVTPVCAYLSEHCPHANENQFSALCSFGFNLGIGSLETMLSHGWDAVPAQIPRWNHAGGVEVAGLTARRAAEVELFNQV